MTQEELLLNWEDGMAFSTNMDGFNISIDSVPEFGGQNKGPRPKPFMMLALAGCTGIDVISILKKMRIKIDSFQVKIESQITDEHPKHYSEMKVIYILKGDDLPIDKIKRAVNLSEEQYCGVSAVYKKAMKLKSEIQINGEIIE
ncbi:MAG: OsmC family protein [Bacteroidales bacterium]|nr:OsmC family protein [Bacteroidales bacterium]